MARITKKNLSEFQEKLLAWYRLNGRKFPWRGIGLSQYELIIAEILLQRTKAETISSFYQKFITRFPGWDELNSSTVYEVEDFLKPIGLFRQRAKRIKALAREMVLRKNKLPEIRDELETIPLFGQYIVNSIELLILGRVAPLLDVNMARLLERYFRSRSLADIRYDKGLQALALNVVSHEDSKEVNWAILDYSALICQARKPKCSICMLKIKCTFFIKLKK